MSGASLRSDALAASRNAWVSGDKNDHADAAERHTKAADVAMAAGDGPGARRHKALASAHRAEAGGESGSSSSSGSASTSTSTESSAAESSSPHPQVRVLAKAMRKDLAKSQRTNPMHAWATPKDKP